ncbi:MAG: ChbG/HpnK family deacetylase [Acidobacteriaceae bacterium]|nr:ChbG/HpnK family deacetylase [Acidobacteriaceae bacterium]
MTARLILNADDFGLTCGINRAIGELHAAGALSSATLMASGAAFDDAVALALSRPALGVGCHVVLVDGAPVSPPQTIRSLIGDDGKNFRPSLGEFLRALLLGRIDADEVAREAAAQVERLQRAGIAVTHLDTHKHVHVFPAIARPLLQVAERCGVGAMRNPFEPGWSLRLGHGNWRRRLSLRLIGSLRSRFLMLPSIREGRVRTTDGTAAISATGQLNSKTLGEILRALPASGTVEICCHPGTNDGDLDRVRTRLRGEREVERAALLDEVSRGLIQNGTSPFGAPALIHYGNLAR